MPHDMRRTPSQASPPPAPPYYTASQAAAPTRKADQIVQNFYSKVAQIITQARLIQYDSLSSGNILPNTNLALNPRQTSHHQKRPNKWFNLEMWDSDAYKEDLKYWRHIVTSTGLPPNPMIMEFFLDTSELPKNKILVINDEILKRRKVDVHISGENEDGKSKNILLESWQLTLSPLTDSPPDLPVVYKKSIAFFRSLYAYVRLLPAFRLFKRIKMQLNHDLKIGFRFVLPNTEYVDDIGIDVPIIDGETGNVSSQFIFNPIDTPIGVLSLKTKYRTSCEFYVDESEEEIISANFMMVDFDEQFFTPTVVKYYQEQEQKKQKEERRKSVPTKMNTPPSGYLFPGNSPQYNNPLSGGIPRSNPENTELTFPKIHDASSRLPAFTSTLSNNTTPSLTLRSSDSRRSLENPAMSRSGRYDNLSSSRPNVTLVQPFKSPSLSSSPSQDNLPSPTFSERSSPLHRSPSSLSLQQRSSTRPLSLSGGATLSSSVKSNSSAGSLPKFYTSFSYRHERNSGSSGRESVSSRKRSRSSLTNRSDGSTSDRGSFNSSFFASLDPEDDVGEFVRLVDTHEPLKMFSRNPPGSDSVNMEGNMSKSKQLQLSRFKNYRESHNTLSDSITSLTLHSSPQQLEPSSALGTSSGSVSSSISSINKPNVPSRLSENIISNDEHEEFIQASSRETHELGSRSSGITSGGILEKGTGMGIVQTDYSPYSGDFRINSSNYNQQSRLHKTNSESKDSMNNQSINNEIIGDRKSNTEGMNIPVFNYASNDDITGSPASGNSLRNEEELMLFNLNLSDEKSSGANNDVPVKFEKINNTLETITENNQADTQKMSRIDE